MPLLDVDWGELKLDEWWDRAFGMVHKRALLEDLVHTPMAVLRWL